MHDIRVRPRGRLADDVAARLRDLIRSGQFAPGQQLRQIELAELLGVSRTPLREAFRVLEHEGLLRVSNGNHTVEVAQPSLDELLDVFQVRQVLAALAARLAAERGLAAEAEARLVDAVQRMRRCLRPLDLDGCISARCDFHEALLEASGNQRLRALPPDLNVVAEVSLARRWVAAMAEQVEHDVDRIFAAAVDDVEAVLAAIRAGDVAAAESKTHAYVQQLISGATDANLRFGWPAPEVGD
jgi:GntR family transcriptional regulator of vanillate catabolism